jgi:hypothetical protein
MFPITGPTFLLVYVALFAAGLLAHWLLRHHLRRRARPIAAAELSIAELSAEHVGYLLGGPTRAAAARSVARRLGEKLASSDVESLLAGHGIVLDARQLASLRLWGVAMFGGLLAAGIARAYIGLDRGTPVGPLLVVMIGVGLRLAMVLRTRALRTRAGDALVERLKHRHLTGLAGPSTAMGFALYGGSARSASPSSVSCNRGSSDGCCGGCGSGGCGSGGCGSGGCGSGGCSS